MGGYRYIVFLIDAHSRFVFYDFIKSKGEAAAACLRGMAAFDATVGTTVDDEKGRHRPLTSLTHAASPRRWFRPRSCYLRDLQPLRPIDVRSPPQQLPQSLLRPVRAGRRAIRRDEIDRMGLYS